MESKPSAMEVEEAKSSELNRFGDQLQQQKLTRRILLKLDTRWVVLLQPSSSKLMKLESCLSSHCSFYAPFSIAQMSEMPRLLA